MGKINDLKDQALATLKGKWGSFVGLTFIYLLIYSLCCFLAMFGTIFEGSSFTGLAATFSFIGSILQGKSVAVAHETAVKVSAYVCTQKGAMPVVPDELKAI